MKRLQQVTDRLLQNNPVRKIHQSRNEFFNSKRNFLLLKQSFGVRWIKPVSGLGLIFDTVTV